MKMSQMCNELFGIHQIPMDVPKDCFLLSQPIIYAPSNGCSQQHHQQQQQQHPIISRNDPYCVYSSHISQSMDLVWHGQFNACFGTYGHMWTLLPVSDITPTGDWNMFQDSAKIRFICSDCNNCWTSMKGRVQFWFYLLSTGEGFVYFQLFGQRCKKCKSEKFQNAIWYPEEVTKVINNVYHKVGQMYYGMHEQLATIRHERRAGKPRERHDSDLCQACSQGKCREASLACS